MHGLSDERAEYLIKDRLSFMRFLGLGLADAVPDANTIWTYREALKRAGAVQALFARFDAMLRAAGYLAMGGQIVDATIVAAPKQHNTEAERAAIKAGQVPKDWAERPAKLRQKDRDARWTVKFSKAKPREDGTPQVDIAVPCCGLYNPGVRWVGSARNKVGFSAQLLQMNSCGVSPRRVLRRRA
jgi:IS5 family transposase